MAEKCKQKPNNNNNNSNNKYLSIFCFFSIRCVNTNETITIFAGTSKSGTNNVPSVDFVKPGGGANIFLLFGDELCGCIYDSEFF